MDVRLRGSYVAIGAALLNARIAAAHGILGSVDRFPDGEDADVLVDVNFGDATGAELAGSYGGMFDRSTNAAGLAVQPVSPLSLFAVDDSDFTSLVAAPYVAHLQALTSRLRSLAGLEDGVTIALVARLSHVGAPSTRSLRMPLETILLDALPQGSTT